MWTLLEFVVLAAVVLFSITEFFYPLLVGKPLFNSFRKKTPQPSTLEDELSRAKQKVAEAKKVQNKVDEHLKSAEQLKEESDKLFNK
ncbi:MAG TPA: hypothetical protein VGQ59_12415 [Cyclobacteriaceae bacterium]|jgi:hypothetical protein|nr:hypothetical protein [Cyclobacteriaceae bacterium]